MKTVIRLFQFFGIVAVLSLVLLGVLLPFLGFTEAATLTGLMVLPHLWCARLALAVGTGRITKRFLFLENANISGVWQITNPEVLERSIGAWGFYSYVVREGFLCLVLWGLMSAAMIYPRIEQTVGFNG